MSQGSKRSRPGSQRSLRGMIRQFSISSESRDEESKDLPTSGSRRSLNELQRMHQSPQPPTKQEQLQQRLQRFQQQVQWQLQTSGPSSPQPVRTPPIHASKPPQSDSFHSQSSPQEENGIHLQNTGLSSHHSFSSFPISRPKQTMFGLVAGERSSLGLQPSVTFSNRIPSPRRMVRAMSGESSQFLSVHEEGSSWAHQRSNESHDSTNSYVSGVSMASTSGASAATTSIGYASGSETEVFQPLKIDSMEEFSAPTKTEDKTIWMKTITNLKQKRGNFFKKKAIPVKDVEEIDPIYHLLKCAANQKGQTCGNCSRPKIGPVTTGCVPQCQPNGHKCSPCKCPCHTHNTDPSNIPSSSRELNMSSRLLEEKRNSGPMATGKTTQSLTPGKSKR